MAKKSGYKPRKQHEEVLNLEDLQSMRKSAKGFHQRKEIQTKIDLHFMPPKPKRKKKEKKKRFYKERN